jgi:hypothetical protein
LSPVGDVASAVENASAAYSGTTAAPHEYFDHTGKRPAMKSGSSGDCEPAQLRSPRECIRLMIAAILARQNATAGGLVKPSGGRKSPHTRPPERLSASRS